MAPQTFAHGLLAQLIEATTTTTLTETPACLPRWKVSHPNGAVLVANTARPLQDGTAALVSAGYITAPATALVELWIEQERRKAFPPMTAQQILASAA